MALGCHKFLHPLHPTVKFVWVKSQHKHKQMHAINLPHMNTHIHLNKHIIIKYQFNPWGQSAETDSGIIQDNFTHMGRKHKEYGRVRQNHDLAPVAQVKRDTKAPALDSRQVTGKANTCEKCKHHAKQKSLKFSRHAAKQEPVRLHVLQKEKKKRKKNTDLMKCNTCPITLSCRTKIHYFRLRPNKKSKCSVDSHSKWEIKFVLNWTINYKGNPIHSFVSPLPFLL